MTTRKKAKKPKQVPRSDEYKKEVVKLADTVPRQLLCPTGQDNCRATETENL